MFLGVHNPNPGLQNGGRHLQESNLDTKTSQSGFSYQKVHSINIAIYECKGLQAAGVDSDMEDEDEVMWRTKSQKALL